MRGHDGPPVQRQLLDELVPKLDNASVIDWYSKSDGHRDWFLDDGVHLTEVGRKAYADLIEASVDDLYAALL